MTSLSSTKSGQPTGYLDTTVVSFPVPGRILPRDKMGIMEMPNNSAKQYNLVSSILIWTAKLGGMFKELPKFERDVRRHSVSPSYQVNSNSSNIPVDGTYVDSVFGSSRDSKASTISVDIPTQLTMENNQANDVTGRHLRNNESRSYRNDYNRLSLPDYTFCSKRSIYKSCPAVWRSARCLFPDSDKPDVPKVPIVHKMGKQSNDTSRKSVILDINTPRSCISSRGETPEENNTSDQAAESGISCARRDFGPLKISLSCTNPPSLDSMNIYIESQPSDPQLDRFRGSPDGQSYTPLHGSTSKVKTRQNSHRNSEEEAGIEMGSLFSAKLTSVSFVGEVHPPSFFKEPYDINKVDQRMRKSKENSYKSQELSDIREVVIKFINKDEIEYEVDNFGQRQVVGEGAFGVVHLADMYLANGARREVVIKESDSELYDNRSILREARILAYLGDTQFVPRFYGVVCDGTAWADPCRDMGIVQEYFGKGCTLANVMKLQFEILSSQKFWLDVCMDMVRGMSQIHEKRVLLNDVKPNNILVDCNMYKKVSSRIRYIDMGIATYESVYNFQLPRNYLVRFQHLAPEVMKGSNTSIASDVYSLGYILLELAESRRIPCVEEIAHDCMHHSPKKRPSCQEILAEIEQLSELIESDDIYSNVNT